MSETPPPEGLQEAGRALWTSILADLEGGWELDARELHFLEHACRCADEMADLEAAVDRDGSTVTGSRGQIVVHPARSEVRQLRLVQLRLLATIELVDPDAKSATGAQAQARKAAEARWNRRRRIHG